MREERLRLLLREGGPGMRRRDLGLERLDPEEGKSRGHPVGMESPVERCFLLWAFGARSENTVSLWPLPL